MLKDEPTSKLGEAYLQSKAEINRKYRGHVRKARLMINDLTYALGLIEGELGAEQVRDNWRGRIDRMWLCGRAPDTMAREHMLMALDWAASSYEEPRVAGQWKKPRKRESRHLLTDANRRAHFIDMEWPEMDEAAQEGLAFLAGFDPELAAQIPQTDFAQLIPIWLSRGENAGRRGKEQRIDDALCALVRSVGLPAITAEAMRQQRLAWEREWPEQRRKGSIRRAPGSG